MLTDMPRQLLSVYRYTGLGVVEGGFGVLPNGCGPEFVRQPEPPWWPAGAAGAWLMASEPATATARPATAPIRTADEVILRLSGNRMETPFVGFPGTRA